MTDRRLTPATERVALDSWRDRLQRPTYTPGRAARLAVPVADLCRAPDGARDRQVNFGADLLVIDETGPWAFVQAQADGYCGWLRAEALTGERPVITHRVAAPATHVYPEPNLKTRELFGLSLGAGLAVTGFRDGFAALAGGGWVPAQHVTDQPARDPGAVAQSLLGTPYLWGGNSRWGIDCSGLAQAALTACAIACPGDSDMQQAAFPATDQIGRGDLLFWPGHVAMALDAERMIHATAYSMSVIIEPITDAIARIDAAGQGPFRGAHRPPPPQPGAGFP
jgi:cell wall-associated NlpC family hydrolase